MWVQKLIVGFFVGANCRNKTMSTDLVVSLLKALRTCIEVDSRDHRPRTAAACARHKRRPLHHQEGKPTQNQTVIDTVVSSFFNREIYF
jgi:hypothetical protein